MHAQKFPLAPPSLGELAEKLRGILAANFEHSTASVVTCPDLRKAPFHLAAQGLSGEERAADVGGQPNLFPYPRKDAKWSMLDIAKAMDMSPHKGSLIGAGCGPFHKIGCNSELSPNISWQDGFDNSDNNTRLAKIKRETGAACIETSPCPDCALMINLFGSQGETGPVIKVTARKRTGPEKSLTECIRKGLHAAYGDERTISLGGVFLIKSGRTWYHIMPDFPSEQELPFESPAQLNDWLTYHDFDGPIVCMTLLHSADKDKAMGLRMEHSHGFCPSGRDAGGHYHGDMDESKDEIEYEAYFNTAKVLYRLEKPEVTLERDLHD